MIPDPAPRQMASPEQVLRATEVPRSLDRDGFKMV